jgi:CRISPR system Cascade subunit CasC
MLIELHILQNFAPSNLNRDDMNAPKECEFGGYRRARISSQCLKRAIRTAFKEDDLLSPGDLATRTKRLLESLVVRLEAHGRDADESHAVAQAALGGVGLSVGADNMTQYLLFLGEREIDGLADVCNSHWDTLVALVAPSGDAAVGKAAKKQGKAAVPKEVTDALNQVLDGGRAADLALFGRMLADRSDLNVDAACQVAHAISTNQVAPDFDFFTAVDDLKPADNAGAGMLGTVEFNSACFYRYANVDVEQLRENLKGDEDLVERTLQAFVRASVAAIPTGKQNSMAAHNPPSLVFAVVRSRGPQNLSNAFVQPVRPTESYDLIQRSAAHLDDHRGRLAAMYGETGVEGAWVASLDGSGVEHLGERVSIDGLVEAAVQAAVRA